MRLLILVLASLLSACRAPANDSDASQSASVNTPVLTTRSALTRAGRFQVTWTPSPVPIPINEPFEIEVTVVRPADGQRVEGATISVSGWMPGHGHGMVRVPQSEEDGRGVYRVHGMLFHMSGSWELSIDVIHESVAESVMFELELE